MRRNISAVSTRSNSPTDCLGGGLKFIIEHFGIAERGWGIFLQLSAHPPTLVGRCHCYCSPRRAKLHRRQRVCVDHTPLTHTHNHNRPKTTMSNAVLRRHFPADDECSSTLALGCRARPCRRVRHHLHGMDKVESTTLRVCANVQHAFHIGAYCNAYTI